MKPNLTGPDSHGHFGIYGGRYVAETLMPLILEVEKAYALACFNVLAYNRDDHGRNFSFLLEKDRRWALAPAYDLTFSHGPNGEQSMLLLGEVRTPGVNGLTELGRKHGIKRANQILARVQAAVVRWLEFSKRAGVGKRSSTQIEKTLGTKS